MRMFVHRVTASAALPFILDDLKLHLRCTDGAEDAAIQNIGKTSAAELEQFAQIALLSQTIKVTIFDPNADQGLHLPIGPVLDANALSVTVDGAPFAEFDLIEGIRPYIRWSKSYHDQAPSRVTIEYVAGFGAAAIDIPSDLAQALMDQAALHYDGRSPMDAKSLTTSPHMARIGARYRGVRA